MSGIGKALALSMLAKKASITSLDAVAADLDTTSTALDLLRAPVYQGKEVPLLIILGQSNADGRGLQSEVPGLAGVTWTGQVRMYNKPITRNPASSAVNHVDNGSWVDFNYSTPMVVSPQGSGPMGSETAIAVEWARSFYATAGKPLHIIKVAIGGTPLVTATSGADTNWGTAADQIWDLALNHTIRPALRKMLLDGKVPRCVGIYWAQGETDADVSASASGYEAALRSLITSRIRAKCGFPDARVLCMGLSAYTHPTPANWAAVKNAQIAVCEGSNKLTNCRLIRTDGSDTQAPAQRYKPGVSAGDIHYTGVGLSAIATKIISNLEFPGSAYTKSNDLELIVSRSRLAAPVSTADLFVEATVPGGIVSAASLPAVVGGVSTSVPSITWLSDPSVVAKVAYNATPMTRFELVPLRGSNDVEVIFQMAHDGDGNTKPGVLLRCTTRAATSGGTLPAQDGIAQAYLMQVRSGGGQLTFFKLLNGVYTALAGSPLTPTQSPTVNALYWYRVTMIGSTLTCYNSPDGATWTQQFTASDASFTSGDTYFTLFNGELATTPPYAAHCHFPVLIGNKLG